jgi:thioredoxin reductase
METQSLPVAVIGAGPVGLAAAAHLLERGETPIVFEAGSEVGANIRNWQHVRMFSPWRYTVDSASVRLLEPSGWQMPDAEALPTGADLIDEYLKPLAALPQMSTNIHFNARVIAVSRVAIDKMKDTGRDNAPFELHIQYADGREELVLARAVIDAAGTWHNPNPLGANGLAAVGEGRLQSRIVYGIPDVRTSNQARYANKRVMVVGSGHSAINALLELAELRYKFPRTAIYWVMRGSNLRRVLGGGQADALPARGQLGTRLERYIDAGIVTILSPFRIRQLVETENGVLVSGDIGDQLDTIEVDEIVAATGARPDIAMLRELRLDLDSSLESTRTLGPMIDPNIHSCGTVPPHGEAELRHPEKNFYIVGMKSYGRAPTFLLATGYEQVRSVVAYLVGDFEAAAAVEFVLPETGVCSSDLAEDGAACCGTVSKSEPVLSLASIPINGVLLQPVGVTSEKSKGCCS